jgi:hypothetical protein
VGRGGRGTRESALSTKKRTPPTPHPSLTHCTYNTCSPVSPTLRIPPIDVTSDNWLPLRFLGAAGRGVRVRQTVLELHARYHHQHHEYCTPKHTASKQANTRPSLETHARSTSPRPPVIYRTSDHTSLLLRPTHSRPQSPQSPHFSLSRRAPCTTRRAVLDVTDTAHAGRTKTKK